jgi:BASS family bile acid:Na+ symporter
VNGPAHKLRQACLAASAVSLLVVVVGLVLSRQAAWHPAAVVFGVCLALGLGAVTGLKGYQFTMWVIAAVIAAMVYPQAFQQWGPLELRNKWLILVIVQLVMFGMGTQMTIHEFNGIVRMPRAVIVGSICQFSIMPLVGFSITRLFHFPPEINAGIILIGACSSGLASNVLTYLAGGNLALSITLTACSTLIAPVMTPLWMKLLAAQYVPVKFFPLMMEVIKIVIVPVAAALLHDVLRRAPVGTRRVIVTIAVAGAVYFVFLAFGGWNVIERVLGTFPAPLQGLADAVVTVTTYLLVAVVAGTVYNGLWRRWPSLDRAMPVFSMFGIVYFTLVTTAVGRASLLTVGPLLFVAAAMHNTIGYLLGYFLSRAGGLDVRSARTVAFEVGLHNGGMATGLAAAMERLGTVGLPAAIFSPWMNISGSVLANYWRKRQPPSPPQQPEAEAEDETPRGFEPVPAQTVVRTS